MMPRNRILQIPLVTFLMLLITSVLFVPGVNAQQATLALNPSSGPAGTTVTVTGTGFPPNSEVIVGPGVYATEPVTTQQVNADAQGEFRTEVTIPVSASPDDRWVIMANPLASMGSSILADFEVLSEGQPEEPVYVVQPGDTLSEVARRFGVTLTALITANPQIENPNLIYAGQEVVIPGEVIEIPETGEPAYVVASGDTLLGIASRFGVTLNELLGANPDIENPNLIFAGQRLALPSDVPIADPGEPEDPRDQPEPIMILEPAPGSRVFSPVTVRGVADPTHEQQLGIRIYAADGTLLAESFTSIDAELGQRGPFAADVEIDVEQEQNAFIQVFRQSARDGAITHLSSVGVTLANAGEEAITTQEPHNQRVVITSPAAQPVETISGGTARVEGFGLASFEQTLVVEVQDEAGNVIGQSPVIVDAPDLGEPGPFEAEVEYELDAAQPGRIVVRDPSPAFGGDVYLTSVEVQLEP